MKWKRFELTQGSSFSFFNGVSSPERNLAKPALVNTVGSEMRLKKSGEREICSIYELYNFASVETPRHQFLPRKTNQTKQQNWGGGSGRRMPENSSMRCKFPSPTFYFNEKYLVPR